MKAIRWGLALLAFACLIGMLAACNERLPVGYPAARDVQESVERKPVPSESILTDPNASTRHNSALEAWGERISAAAIRICRNLAGQGMPNISCPPAPKD